MTYTSAKVAELQATLNQELSSYEESPRNVGVISDEPRHV